MATERTQYSTFPCALLWEEFPRLSSICAELILSFKYLDILSGPFDKVDEIDMLLKDSLGETRTLKRENSLRNYKRTARQSLRVSGTGSMLRT
jgi:hypothetical protein